METYSFTCVILPNSVILGQTVRAYFYGDPPEKFDQGHLRSLEPTWIDRLPMTSR